MKTALFIGRFQPFHLGHLDALKQIATDYDLIKIGIGSAKESGTQKNPYSAEIRFKMIETIRKEIPVKIEIFEIPDINDDLKWVCHVQQIVGDFDIVFSGNDHVLQLFKVAKIRTKRQSFNIDISATKIREMIKENDLRYKKFLPKKIINLIGQFKHLF